MTTEELKESAKQYFEAYPKDNVVYFTTDGQAFMQANYSDGMNHQRRINAAGKIEKITRKQVYGAPEQTGGTEETGGDDGDAKFPTVDNTKEEIVAWLAEKGVTADVKEKKDDLLQKVVAVMANEEDGGGAGDGE